MKLTIELPKAPPDCSIADYVVAVNAAWKATQKLSDDGVSEIMRRQGSRSDRREVRDAWFFGRCPECTRYAKLELRAGMYHCLACEDDRALKPDHNLRPQHSAQHFRHFPLLARVRTVFKELS